MCLVISLAECAPSEVATLGAANGGRKRRAVKALEIDVLLDAPRRENQGKNDKNYTFKAIYYQEPATFRRER